MDFMAGLVNLGATKVPPGSQVMQLAWEACERMNTSELKWSQCGPTLLRQLIDKCSLEDCVKPWTTFCPIHFAYWEQMLDESVSWTFDDTTHAIHLWNELWRRAGQDKDARYPAGCLYEQLKQRYLR